MKDNKHQMEIPEEVLEQVRSMLSESIRILTPYTVALTPSERQTLPIMGDKTLSFVEKTRDLLQQNPNLRPPYLDMAEFNIDFADAHGLWTITNMALQLDELLSDTVMAASSEAYQSALVFYSAVKEAAEQDVPGARAVYEDLKVRFPASKRQSSTVETETVTEMREEEIKISQE
jgi:hypothetical protein